MNIVTLEYDLTYLNASVALNGFSILLLLIVVCANFRTFKTKSKEARYLKLLFFVAIVASILELSSCFFNGVDGKALFYLSYTVNTLNYILLSLFGYIICLFVRVHFFKNIHKKEIVFASIPLDAVIIMVIINLFIPIVFKIDRDTNTYVRLGGYYGCLAVTGLYLVMIIAIYALAIKRAKTTRYFPLYLFIVPIILGTIAQTLAPGLSLEWASISIGLVGVVSSINNEKIFRDELTGLYNRAFFNYYIKHIIKKRKIPLTGIMMDINDFKQINDKFGHDVGDLALKEFANQLIKAVGTRCSVIRLSGDEFVVLLRSNLQSDIDACINKIKESILELNNQSNRRYQLFAAIGYAIYRPNEEAEEFLSEYDEAMYLDKQRYHSKDK